ncbi:30S ribosomal protein S16 [Salinibacter ruber]|uniref:Small ribosomal subunit protein bS16 n=1 Tax=Salinibacter ruber TaxID=146919 RepID=A0A9X2RCF9_9BACT|nr:30S ribosomal protein S16 [Salinibacter ruber]MCS3858782.1 small subunit ribosomal protein S16 [Salinibacter ruber]MCS3865539.1 small subunit ribosomal protein S16 [Salinibacter ruber]MCS4151191.1 small subunit ribosomal protein S16 [Salinibacter ruber]
MSVKLRLRRIGRKKIPVYSIVAADQRNARDGRYIEDIGRYFPLREPAEVRLEEDRALYWLENGAQPSDTVRSILRRRGLLLHHHLKKKGESPGEIESAVEEFRERMAEQGEEVKIAVGTRGQDPLERERERAEEIDEEAQLRAQATPLSAVQEETEAEDVETADAEDADAASETDEPEAAADEADETDASADADDNEEPEDE